MSTDEKGPWVLLERAYIALSTRRYQDAAFAMRLHVETQQKLVGYYEISLFAKCFKALIDFHRVSLHNLKSNNYIPQQKIIAQAYSKNIECEIKNISLLVLHLLDNHLLPQETDEETEIYYLRIRADYYRYIAEVVPTDLNTAIIRGAIKSYDKVYERSKRIPAASYQRIAIALNFSIFYESVLNNTKMALHVAQKALDEAKYYLRGSQASFQAEYLLSKLSTNIEKLRNKMMADLTFTAEN